MWGEPGQLQCLHPGVGETGNETSVGETGNETSVGEPGNEASVGEPGNEASVCILLEYVLCRY